MKTAFSLFENSLTLFYLVIKLAFLEALIW